MPERATHTTSKGPPPTLSPAVQSGDRLGRYVLLDIIGTGGMSVVYRAIDPELARHVAIKILRRGETKGDGTTRSRWRARMLAEAQAMAKLQHPNVIAVHDVGSVGEDVFIAMELVSGHTLARWVMTPRSVDAIVGAFADAARGLAAAHAAGVIHRDFKPSNVMVSEDGRVRVLDFGVACATSDSIDFHEERGEDSSPSGGLAPSGQHTQVGALVGTPSYMAPELAGSGQASPASDQFAWCVALYEALWKRKPFPAKGGLELRKHIGSRRVLEPPGRPKVANRLRRLVLRGLSADAGARYPSMDALIADLEAMALARRRRRYAALGALALAVAGLTVAGAALWRRHQVAEAAAMREQAASARLGAMESRVDELIAGGRIGDADSTFVTFARLDENRGTDALARAWLHRARWMQAQERHGDEVAAWASAWASAPGPARQAEALVGLGGAFHRRWEWDRLAVALGRLEGDLGRHAADRDVVPLRINAQLARRELAAAAATIEKARGLAAPGMSDLIDAAPIIHTLAGATRTDVTAQGVVTAEVGGVPALLVLPPTGDQVIARRLDRTLTPLWTAPLDAELGPAYGIFALPVAPGELYLLAWQHRADGSRGVLYRVDGGKLAREYAFDDPLVTCASAVDVDGDGRAEIFVGSGPYKRSVTQLVRGPSGWKDVENYHDLGSGSSDVLAIRGADLDGDRRSELVMAVGAWHAYDVRVVRPVADGLATQTRRKLGVVDELGFIHTPAGIRIAAVKSDIWPSRIAFPTGDHYGERPGIHLLSFDGGQLMPAGLVQAPRPEAGPRRLDLQHLVIADLDGDRLEDMATVVHSAGRAGHVLVARQRGDGTFASALIGALDVLAAVELDGDPGAELVVQTSDDRRLWILGMGSETLPPLPPPPPPEPAGPRPAAASRDPAIARMWSGAEELVAMGLGAEAAELFDQIAELGGAVTDAALLRAGALWEAEGLLDRAAERFAEVAPRNPAAALRAARLRARHHDFDGAHQLATDLAGRGDASVDERAAASQLAATVAPHRAASSLSLAFSTSLDPAWHILQPETLRRDLREGALRVDAFSNINRMAELPVIADDDWIRLSVALEVDRTEWGSGVQVELAVPEAGELAHIGVGIGAFGGGAMLERIPGCVVPGDGWLHGTPIPIDSVADSQALVLTVDYVPSQGEAWCTVASGGHILHRERLTVNEKLPAGASVLAITRGGESVNAPTWASARIRRIDARGLRVVSGAPDAAQRGHHLLVEGDTASALAAYDSAPAPSDPAWVVGRVAALWSLGGRDQAVAALRGALPNPAIEGGLWRLVRLHDRAFVPLAQAALGRRFVQRFVSTWGTPLRMHNYDPRVQDLVTGIYGAVAELPVATPIERYYSALLLAFRGDAWWRQSHFGDARADLERAVSLGEPLLKMSRPADVKADEALPDRIAEAHVLLAAIHAAASDDAAALEHARAALAVAAHPDEVRDALAGFPELAARRGRAGWHDVLPP